MTTSYFTFNDATTNPICTLSLHDALPIYQDQDHRGQEGRPLRRQRPEGLDLARATLRPDDPARARSRPRSEEHTSELRSPYDLVCRLLLEKKNLSVNAAILRVTTLGHRFS